MLSACETLMTRTDLKEQEQKKQLQDIQRSSADTSSKFSDIESDLRNLNGRIDTLDNRIEKMDAEKKANAAKESEHLAKLQLLQDEVTKLENQMNLMQSELAKRSERSSDSNSAGNDKPEKKESQFDIAEDHFEKKNWKKAALAFQKFKEIKPKDKRIPEAIFKTGVCFVELGLTDDAKPFFEEVIEKYPNSSEAKKAKAKLKTVKK
jgi:TolA-binding protein